MGTSTVSGPFRSANGFQQLDENGVWVPVTGGGGGGGITTIIIPDPSTITPIPVMTPGQTLALVGGPAAVNGDYLVAFPSLPGTDSVSIAGLRTKMSFPYDNQPVFVSGGNAFVFSLGNGFTISGKFYFLLTYVGIDLMGIGAPLSEYRMFGMG